MKYLVIQVKQDGKTLYVRSANCLSKNALVEDVRDAFNYAGQPKILGRDLDRLVVPGDQYRARSGVRIDELPTVIEFQLTEVRRYVGRQLHVQ